MLDQVEAQGRPFPFTARQQKELWVIHTLYQQQKEMYDNKTHRCDHRIVSISQPHVRPIVRGKQGKEVEFGPKLGLSLANGYVANETLSWEAYNESGGLISQVNPTRLYMVIARNWFK